MLQTEGVTEAVKDEIRAAYAQKMLHAPDAKAWEKLQAEYAIAQAEAGLLLTKVIEDGQ